MNDNICKKCGCEYHIAVIRSSRVPISIVKDIDANTRWCVNESCPDFGVFYVKCVVCGEWFDSESNTCSNCKHKRR